MDVIEMTRALGKAIQEDDRYLAMRLASQGADADVALQGMIGEFNLKKLAISNEASKTERDEEKLQKLNTELRTLYRQIMENEKMIVYQTTKKELDSLVQRINAILTLCAEGQDPETADFDPSACSGNCSSCGGCH